MHNFIVAWEPLFRSCDESLAVPEESHVEIIVVSLEAPKLVVDKSNCSAIGVLINLATNNLMYAHELSSVSPGKSFSIKKMMAAVVNKQDTFGNSHTSSL